ncbi:DUF4046 domain-containing protein [Bacillus cereus]|nr:DUF4046 domain-containing protein [Bacillus cereus]MEB9178833.1 DUF4046 domain-containing protein [Bacillus cereus]
MTLTIEEIYQEILNGKRTKFPSGTWNENTSHDSVKRVTRYLIEEVLQWNDEDIRENWTLELIIKYKLRGACSILFKDSPYKMLDTAYPNRFQKWDLKHLPKNSWTRDKALNDLRYWIEEKEKLTKEQLLDVYSGSWLRERGLDSPLQMYWNSSPYKLLNEAFPNQFREWDLKKVPDNCWEAKEKCLAIFKEIIEKQKMSRDDIKEHYSLNWIKKNRLRGALIKFWADSPYKLLNEAFPNQFREWDLKEAPNGTWSDKEIAKKIIKDEIKKSGLSISQLLDKGVRKWMKKNKLTTPFNKHWNSSPIKMLKELYPEEFRNQIDNQ